MTAPELSPDEAGAVARFDAAEPAPESYCDCILNDPGSPWGGHARGEHDKELCPGRWTDEPPCGGCINCDMARAYYYAELGGDHA